MFSHIKNNQPNNWTLSLDLVKKKESALVQQSEQAKVEGHSRDGADGRTDAKAEDVLGGVDALKDLGALCGHIHCACMQLVNLQRRFPAAE